MLASLDRDPQVAAAALAAENAARQLGTGEEKLSLLAYSDGSVIADGIEGSAAAVIRIGSVDACATVRLAAADRALSSGRSEWAGLLLVKRYDGACERTSLCVLAICRWSTSLTMAKNTLLAIGCGKTNVAWRR